MRVNTWGIGVVIAASVLLTGCSAGPAEKPADEKPSSSSQEETTESSSDCPELAEGATVDGAELGACMAEAMQATAGYAATTTALGMETTGRYNPSEDAMETTSPMGSMIAIGDESWVKSPTSEWQVSDPASSDPVIAGLSMGAQAAAQIDAIAVMTALSGDFTVTGTGERLGQEVFLVSGTVDQQGTAVDTVFEITADYVSLASSSTTTANGMTVDTTFVVTEWDVAQDIVAPL